MRLQQRRTNPTVDDLKAQTAATIADLYKHQDKVLDELAITVAIGGSYAPQASTELQKQWTNKNNNTNGLDQFVANKRGQLEQ
jgi:hypothetical protein